MHPPIAAPDGSPATPEFSRPVYERAIELNYRLSVRTALRDSIKRVSTLPFLILGVLFITTFATLNTSISLPPEIRAYPQLEQWVLIFGWVIGVGLAICVFAALLSFCFDQRKTLILTSEFLMKRERNREMFIAWRQVVWTMRWSNDIVLSTLMDGVFIPRKAFKSPEEAQEFFEILRTLRKSRGAAWKDEWNGRIFGFPVSFNSSE